MGWSDRLEELAVFRPEGAEWADVWALIVQGQRRHTLTWTQEHLWTWKLASWLIEIDASPTTCRMCGGRIEDGTALSRYCCPACRKAAYRRRNAGQPTPFAERVAVARADLRRVRTEIEAGHRTIRRLQQMQCAFTFPPDLARLDHLPVLPRRCGCGCHRDSQCTHTGGGICLFAATGDVEDVPSGD